MNRHFFGTAMRFEIRHNTRYEYEVPASYSIQLLRVTPQTGSGQTVSNWRIQAPTTLAEQVDAFGNLTHLMTIARPVQRIDVVVTGAVEVADDARSHRFDGAQGVSPLIYTLPTRYTEASDALVELAHRTLKSSGGSEHRFFDLMNAIYERVSYVSGSTNVNTTAMRSYAQGAGVCQDQAHVFLACARVLGVPARYVSGYLNTGDLGHVASHAWVDVYTDAHDWLSLDITHQCVTDGRHCRIAVGRDYDSAAPVRGSRMGGGMESMSAHVFVSAQAANDQQ
jgi:transglutaminase-like putative cysteine protease